MSSCCYYGNRNETNNLILPTIIKISTGPIYGQSPPLQGSDSNCISNNPNERGSIIANANINKIQVESVNFNGIGKIDVSAVILDPPICNTCQSNCNCCTTTCSTTTDCSSLSENCCNLEQPLQGCPKAFTLQVPPKVDSFTISVIAFRNFRYGKPLLICWVDQKENRRC